MSEFVKSILFILMAFGITMVISLLVALMIKIIASAVQRKEKTAANAK
jgi:hypothetical protein